MTPRPIDYDRTSCPPTRVLLARLGLAWGLASGVAVVASLLGGWIGG
jgi:hypothetical protein